VIEIFGALGLLEGYVSLGPAVPYIYASFGTIYQPQEMPLLIMAQFQIYFGKKKKTDLRS
jgi:hypothetical protein